MGKTVLFYKQIGGYETYAKVRGRWYWVNGNRELEEHLSFLRSGEAEGINMVRVGRLPSVLSKAFRLRGRTPATAMATLPHWSMDIGF